MDEQLIRKRASFIINTLYWAIAIALFFLALKYVVPWLLPFILGYLIALCVKPIVDKLVKKLHWSQKFAGAFAMLLAYLVIVTVLVFGGIKLTGSIASFVAGLPDYYAGTIMPGLQDLGNWFNMQIARLLPELVPDTSNLFSTILQSIQDALISISTRSLSALGNITKKIPAFLIAFLFTIMSSLLISMGYQEVTGFISRQIPSKVRTILLESRKHLYNTLFRYGKAYIILMAITFIELSIGLTVLGQKNSIGIAALIAIFDMLPVFGTGGIMIPWILILLVNGDFTMALGMAVLYGIVTLVRNLIEPKIVGDQLGLPPLVTLIAIYVGFKTMGVLGMILLPILLQVGISLQRSGHIRLWK